MFIGLIEFKFLGPVHLPVSQPPKLLIFLSGRKCNLAVDGQHRRDRGRPKVEPPVRRESGSFY